MNIPVAGDAVTAQAPVDGHPEPDVAAKDYGCKAALNFDPSAPSPTRMYGYYLGVAQIIPGCEQL